MLSILLISTFERAEGQFLKKKIKCVSVVFRPLSN